MAINTMTITEEFGVTTSNYPIQFGRPFVLGEITNYPQVLINGVSVTTQSDVKTRWEDGSVKHSIISFYIPTLSANSSITLSFQNQANGNNTGYETKTAMLSASYNFDANIVMTSATTISASARTMLSNDSYFYWTSGSISTTVILADHSISRLYDIGFDSYRSIRPIFHATFWPLINKVKIRYIAEICNTEYLQDQFYSVSLLKGNTSPTQFYTKSSVTHYLNSRWTKESWIGTSATIISVDHNLSYIASTKQIFNYDTTKAVPSLTISADYSFWNSMSRDLYDSGNLTKYMPTTGGRSELGPYPQWTVRWLYTGDYRAKEIAFGNADLAGAWPIHFREGQNKTFVPGISGIGKFVSIKGRPSIALFWLGISDTVVGDKINVISASSNPWVHDMAHQGDFYSCQYLLSGEYWYLEQMLFWASEGVARENPGYRGPTGAYGGISLAIQLRGEGWGFRNRVQAAAFCPDSFIEKAYLTSAIDDAISGWEGKFDLSGTSYTGNDMYNWAKTNYVEPRGTLQNGMWQSDEFFVQEPLDITKVKEGTSTWEHGIMLTCLGRGFELGYNTSALIARSTNFYMNAITNQQYSPYLLNAYRTPTVKLSTNAYYTSWADAKDGYLSSFVLSSSAFELTDTTFSYAYIALAAVAQCMGPGSYESWNFMRDQVGTSTYLNIDPKWALVHRGTGLEPLSASPISPFKVNKKIRIFF